MTTTTAIELMTAEQFFEWANRPENEDALFELEDGKVVEMPSPGELHGTICWLVAHLLGAYVFRRGAGQVCTNDTGLIVRRGPDTVRGPDVLLFLEPRTMGQLNRKHIDRVPALVVEVLSPTDQFSKTHRRVDQYLERGVPLVWVVDPDERAVHVFRPNELRKRLDDTDDLTGNGVLPDFRCKVADLFTLPGQQPATTPTT
jgi:Uma2 family endonuclease